MHDLYFEPKYEEFHPRTIWSLSNAFTSAFKELDPIPQFKATAKLGEFLETQFSQPFWFRGPSRDNGPLANYSASALSTVDASTNDCGTIDQQKSPYIFRPAIADNSSTICANARERSLRKCNAVKSLWQRLGCLHLSVLAAEEIFI